MTEYEMPEVTVLKFKKKDRSSTVIELKRIMEMAENDELSSIMLVAVEKSDGGISTCGYYEDRIGLVGILEYMKFCALDWE